MSVLKPLITVVFFIFCFSVLFAQCDIRGTVYEQTGIKKRKPVYEAKDSIPVILWNSETLKNDTCFSNENGQFEFENIPSGVYSLIVVTGGYLYFERSDIHVFCHVFTDIVIERQ